LKPAIVNTPALIKWRYTGNKALISTNQRIMKRTFITLLFSVLVFNIFAQEDTATKSAVTADTTTQKPKPAALKSYFSASLGFLSNSVYNGRKDSVATPTLHQQLVIMINRVFLLMVHCHTWQEAVAAG